MSYDEVTAEISKLRAKLSQKKSEFIEAKENVEELKSLFSDFENNDLDYNDEKYKEALSAFDSGDYITAQNLSNEAIPLWPASDPPNLALIFPNSISISS